MSSKVRSSLKYKVGDRLILHDIHLYKGKRVTVVVTGIRWLGGSPNHPKVVYYEYQRERKGHLVGFHQYSPVPVFDILNVYKVLLTK